jgi:hypothetical protein
MSTSTARGSSTGAVPADAPSRAASLAQVAGRVIAAIAEEA